MTRMSVCAKAGRPCDQTERRRPGCLRVSAGFLEHRRHVLPHGGDAPVEQRLLHRELLDRSPCSGIKGGRVPSVAVRMVIRPDPHHPRKSAAHRSVCLPRCPGHASKTHGPYRATHASSNRFPPIRSTQVLPAESLRYDHPSPHGFSATGLRPARGFTILAAECVCRSRRPGRFREYRDLARRSNLSQSQRGTAMAFTRRCLSDRGT